MILAAIMALGADMLTGVVMWIKLGVVAEANPVITMIGPVCAVIAKIALMVVIVEAIRVIRRAEPPYSWHKRPVMGEMICNVAIWAGILGAITNLNTVSING